MKLTTYLINDEKFKVRAMQIGSAIWMHVNGTQWVVDLRASQAASKGGGRQAGGANDSGELFAPMPGKILKVNVKNGDSVKAQDILITMEAMKMEYNLLAPFDGDVSQLNCTVGQIVELNQLLVKVEKKK